MPPNPTSSASEYSKGRTERSDKPFLRSLVQNLIRRVGLWVDKLLSFPYARVVMICVVSFVPRQPARPSHPLDSMASSLQSRTRSACESRWA
jgi:hypothetical protein